MHHLLVRIVLTIFSSNYIFNNLPFPASPLNYFSSLFSPRFPLLFLPILFHPTVTPLPLCFYSFPCINQLVLFVFISFFISRFLLYCVFHPIVLTLNIQVTSHIQGRNLCGHQNFASTGIINKYM